MNIREIEKLLDRYFEAETSQEEELLLKQFFLSNDVPAHLQHYVPIFRFKKSEENFIVKTDFEVHLLNRIEQGRRNSFRSRRMWYIASGLAAAVLLLFTIFTEMRPAKVVADRVYSQEEIQLAYLQTKEILAFTSGKINQGTKPLSSVSKINAGTSAVNQLLKLDDGITRINQGLKRIEDGSNHFGNLSKFNLLTNQ